MKLHRFVPSFNTFQSHGNERIWGEAEEMSWGRWQQMVRFILFISYCIEVSLWIIFLKAELVLQEHSLRSQTP